MENLGFWKQFYVYLRNILGKLSTIQKKKNQTSPNQTAKPVAHCLTQNHLFLFIYTLCMLPFLYYFVIMLSKCLHTWMNWNFYLLLLLFFLLSFSLLTTLVLLFIISVSLILHINFFLRVNERTFYVRVFFSA